METVLQLAPAVATLLAWLFMTDRQRRVAARYEPATGAWKSLASVLTPVYDATGPLFERALRSWIDSGADEVVAVIDARNAACIDACARYAAEHPAFPLRVLVTESAGKRAALREGFPLTTSGIVVLVDADTVWSKDFLPEILKPFADPSVGGVAGRDDVEHEAGIVRRAYETVQLLSCSIAIPARIASGQPLDFLTGRSSAYRREALAPAMDGLGNETFRGVPRASGDDVYLAHAVLRGGWKTAYQSTAACRTSAAGSLRALWAQVVRWSRNYFRARYDGYFARKDASSRGGSAQGYVRLAAFLLLPQFLLSFALRGDAAAFAILGAACLASGFAVMRWCGATAGRSASLAFPFLFGQTLTAYGMLFAFFTVEEDAWRRRKETSRSGAARALAGRALFAGTCACSMLAVAAYAWLAHLALAR